ncbi:hypothetical protein [Enterococcus faecium]|uniref:hypothetical protein n=1 Tax=Enterococcus faecium TaxID=1352 RepID=UPI00248B2B2F|nr:hypothetical protein [Enterococcus faecium]
MDQREPRISRKLEKIKKNGNKINGASKIGSKIQFWKLHIRLSLFLPIKKENAQFVFETSEDADKLPFSWVWHPMGREGLEPATR